MLKQGFWSSKQEKKQKIPNKRIKVRWKGKDYIVRRWNWYPPGKIELKDEDTCRVEILSENDYHKIAHLLESRGIDKGNIDPDQVLTN